VRELACGPLLPLPTSYQSPLRRTTFRAAAVDYYKHMTVLGRGIVTATLTGLGVDVASPAVTALFDPDPLPDGGE